MSDIIRREPDEHSHREVGAVVGSWCQPLAMVGDAAVYHVDLAPSEACEAQALAWLGDDERSRWQSYRNPIPRRRFALCRAALRAVIGCHLGLPNDRLGFAITKHGKPFATVGRERVHASFNVSHSGHHGLVAFAPHARVGVDVEDRGLRRNLDGLIRAISSSVELAEFEQLDQDQRTHLFFRLWTLKEAVVKAHGSGISSVAMSGLEIPVAMLRGAPRGVCRFPQNSGSTWFLEDLGSGEYAAALAYETE